jgi:hypothetical protein
MAALSIPADELEITQSKSRSLGSAVETVCMKRLLSFVGLAEGGRRNGC